LPGGLAGRSALGDADDHRVRGMEELRLQHGDPAGGPAGDQPRAVRGRAHRWRLALAAVRAHHPAAAGAGAAGGGGDHGVGLFPAVRRTLCDDPRRSAAEHGERALPHVRRGLPLVEPGARIGHRVRAVRGHPGRGHAAVAHRPPQGGAVSLPVGESRWRMLGVNGALLVLALLSLAPLAWIFSVSFMPRGEAAQFPPPLLPSAPTFDNYRELFARTGMARYFANSLLVALSITGLSLLVNTMAGYAFAKLRFRGRERLFQWLLAALGVPGQAAVLPLFLLMKQLGLVNSYWGVILPAAAGVCGTFLARQYARSLPHALIEAARIDGAGELRIFFRIVLP